MIFYKKMPLNTRDLGGYMYGVDENQRGHNIQKTTALKIAKLTWTA